MAVAHTPCTKSKITKIINHLIIPLDDDETLLVIIVLIEDTEIQAAAAEALDPPEAVLETFTNPVFVFSCILHFDGIHDVVVIIYHERFNRLLEQCNLNEVSLEDGPKVG